MQKVPASQVIYSHESNEEPRIDSGITRAERSVTRSGRDVSRAVAGNVAGSSGNYYPNGSDCQGSVFAGKDRPW